MDEQTLIGIDIAKEKFDVAVRYQGNMIADKFQNTKEGCLMFLLWLKDHGIDSAKVIVESTGSMHWLVCLMLMDASYDVRLINPIITKKYQKSSIRDAKNDRIDAERLVEIARIEADENLPVFFDSRETLKKRRYESLLAMLEHTKQQLGQSYKDAVLAMKSIDVDIDLQCMQNCVDILDTAIETLKTLLTDSASPFATEVAKIRGISLFQATILTNATAGRHFETRDQMVAFFGMDVRVRQSGKWQGKGSLSKRGNPFYRKVLFQIGWSLFMNNPVYKEYYDSIRSREKHYYTCVLATARKFLRHYFSLYQQNSLAVSL